MTPLQEYGRGASLRRLAPLSAIAAGIAWTFCLTTLLFVPTMSPQQVIQGDRPARVRTDLATGVSMILLLATFVLVAIALLGIVQCARSREGRLLQLGPIYSAPPEDDPEPPTEPS
jgi:hypothetical protein